MWAQNFLEAGRASYSEVTPSGTGCRIWGLANGGSLHRKFTLEIDGKSIAAELFRHTAKALTITGCTLDPAVRELGEINKVITWGLVWGERRKAAAVSQTRQDRVHSSSRRRDFYSRGDFRNWSPPRRSLVALCGATSACHVRAPQNGS